VVSMVMLIVAMYITIVFSQRTTWVNDLPFESSAVKSTEGILHLLPMSCYIIIFWAVYA